MTEKITTNKIWAGLIGDASRLEVQFVTKEGRFWNAIGKLLSFLGNKTFMSNFVTTIGPVIAFPPGWLSKNANTPNGCAVLAHELVHVTQFRIAGLGFPWMGVPPMAFVYLLFPLPFGFAFGRWWLESVAYAEGERVRVLCGDRATSVEYLHELMTGPAYFYTLKFMGDYAKRWFIKKLHEPNQ